MGLLCVLLYAIACWLLGVPFWWAIAFGVIAVVSFGVGVVATLFQLDKDGKLKNL